MKHGGDDGDVDEDDDGDVDEDDDGGDVDEDDDGGDVDEDDDDDDGEDIKSAIGPYWRQYKRIACFFLFFPCLPFVPIHH